MAIICSPPDPELGVAVRLAGYLDCQARALGENGFQAIAGGPLATGLLSGVVTIFIALIGYKLILGHVPSLRDGVGWAVRLGIVLTLTTSWPAFQTLLYRVAVDSPGELAAILLPASGLPSNDLDTRVQGVYDTMRLGSTPETGASQVEQAGAQGQAPAVNPPTVSGASTLGQPPLPQTASLLVISTEGVMGGLRIAIGFLLAIGPLLSLALLFDGTLGLFSGWLRGLASAGLGLLAATIVTAIDLVLLEGELAKLQVYSRGGIAMAVDQQALTTITLAFGVAMLIGVLAAVRVASAFKIPIRSMVGVDLESGRRDVGGFALAPVRSPVAPSGAGSAIVPVHSRVGAVTDALAMSVRREQAAGSSASQAASWSGSRRLSVLEVARDEAGGITRPLGPTGRRSLPRRTRSGAARDRVR